ncbi:hypothetical protein [Ruegeria atlantica]|uniref:hypothetical protein n=1 Tax=Ruegeria atlantica TaxID=81569 RepID=UPI00147B4146|nr:hypothetical protein [Ruegeria atlantica]
MRTFRKAARRPKPGEVFAVSQDRDNRTFGLEPCLGPADTASACTVSDWLYLHDLDVAVVKDIASACFAETLRDVPKQFSGCGTDKRRVAEIGSLQDGLKQFIVPAFTAEFGHRYDIAGLLSRVQFEQSARNRDGRPSPVDRGEEFRPVVSLNWNGQVADLIALAHESAHIVQLALSRHDPMPPVARETCAFLGELLLLRYLQAQAPDLFGALCRVWSIENGGYLVEDFDLLWAALADLDTPYRYNLNYPLARLTAAYLFDQQAFSLTVLFESGSRAMRFLPVDEMARQTDAIHNSLPSLPDPEDEPLCLKHYRSVGAAALLDLETNSSQAGLGLREYFTDITTHLKDGTVLIWLSRDRAPMGYATWSGTPDREPPLTLHAVAPFGGHAKLHYLLERRHGARAPGHQLAEEIQVW